MAIKGQGLSMLLVEQDSTFPLRLADYVYVKSRGPIVYESEPENLKDDKDIRSRYLGV
jgi:ABC-type branched-subunit amino acid transport system ATPase component